MKKIILFEFIVIVALFSFVIYKIIDKRVVEIHKIIKIEIPKDKDKDIVEKKELTKKMEGKIFKQYGYIFINGKKSKVGSVVKEGDEVRTSHHSYCVIKFENNSIFKIYPLSKVIIKKSIIKGEKTLILKLLSGDMLSFFAKKGKYNVQTPTSVIGVRGTTFFTTIKEDKTVLCACKGEIDFDSSDQKTHKRHIISKTHQMHVLTKDGYVKDYKKYIPESMRLHDDERIEKLKNMLKNNKNYIEKSEPDYYNSENFKLLLKADKFLKKGKGLDALKVLGSISRKDPYAAFMVGTILENGIGLKKDIKTAEKWYQIAKDLNLPISIK